MARKAKLEERIADTAIDLAEEIGWGSLRLRLVAERRGALTKATAQRIRLARTHLRWR